MKNHLNRLISGLTAHCTRAVTLLILGSGLVGVCGGSPPFSRIIVFGDSLSDTGNFYHLTGGLLPPAPYANGRFSNGPLWIEYLAKDLGMTVLPGDNYAVAGATTGHANSNDGVLGLTFPGLQDQIETFVASQPAGGTDPAALYVVWAGANDFFVLLQSGGSPASLIATGVNNTVQALQALKRAGARHILVVNIPDLGLTPFGLSSGRSASITQLCAAYDQALATALNGLAAASVPTIQVDAFATLQTMAGLPAQFGFTNVTEPFLGTGGDSDRFLFWDAVHPTTRGHEILANQARNDLVDYYSPRNGKSEPTALVDSLKGLLQARKGIP